MNDNVVKKVGLCVAEATFSLMKKAGVAVKPPEWRATSVRFRVPDRFDPDEFAGEVARVLRAYGVMVNVNMGRSKSHISVSYAKWTQKHTDAVAKKRRAMRERKEDEKEADRQTEGGTSGKK
jgi:hypothetical protein